MTCSRQYIICPEQKLVKVEEERDSLQLATRLIAQHKYCQNEGVRQLPTQSYTLTASISLEKNASVWQNVHKNNNAVCDSNNNQQLTMTDLNHELTRVKTIALVNWNRNTITKILKQMIPNQRTT